MTIAYQFIDIEYLVRYVFFSGCRNLQKIGEFFQKRVASRECLTQAGALSGRTHAESVGVVTSGHVTKMAFTPFDPQWPKTPCYMQTSRLYRL